MNRTDLSESQVRKVQIKQSIHLIQCLLQDLESLFTKDERRDIERIHQIRNQLYEMIDVDKIRFVKEENNQ